MFTLQRPSPAAIQRFLDESRDLELSYGPVGMAQHEPEGYAIDELVMTIGRGRQDFDHARVALARWAHFSLGWLEVFPRKAPVETGGVVAVLIRHLGFWSLNGCRIVYGPDRSRGDRFGFAYGTLSNHAERGKEFFEVRILKESQDVIYRIRAASRPRATLAHLGYPLTRMLQARCRRESATAMHRAVQNRAPAISPQASASPSRNS